MGAGTGITPEKASAAALLRGIAGVGAFVLLVAVSASRLAFVFGPSLGAVIAPLCNKSTLVKKKKNPLYPFDGADFRLAAELGLEPRLNESESFVLTLHNSAIMDSPSGTYPKDK